MITSTGKPISHRDLILALLENVQKPTQVAICKCTAHRKGTDPIALGNALTDKTAREATTGPQKTHIYYTGPQENGEVRKAIDKTWLSEMQKTSPAGEKQKWLSKGATLVNGIYTSTEGKPILPTSLFRYAALLSHGQAHISKGGMVQVINKVFTTYGFTNDSRDLCLTCPLCNRYHAQGALRPLRGHFPQPSYPFHTICMDFMIIVVYKVGGSFS